MKRFLILATAFLSFANFAFAQQPNCSGHYFLPKHDIDDKGGFKYEVRGG
jgi:hypothetical protein